MKGNTRHRFRVMVVLPVLLLLAGLPAACGNSGKISTSPATAKTQSDATYVGMSACTVCHTDITMSWLSSRHANTNDSPAGTESYYVDSCKACHDPLGDSGHLVATYTGDPRPVIGCESCHGPGSLHINAGTISRYSGTYILASYVIGTVTASGQFIMCTNCHALLLPDGSQCVSTDPTCSPMGDHTTLDEIIWDTHYATPGTYNEKGQNSAAITGYAMDFSKSTVCLDCHNPHGTADINRDWAASLHASKSTDKGLRAWLRYNWSCDGTDAVSCGPTSTSVAPLINDRRYCQRCHTTTGFAGYMDAFIAGNLTLASGIHAGTNAQLAFSETWKPEMLECRGCHTDSYGTIRNPGAFTATFDYYVTAVSDSKTSGIHPTLWASSQFTYPDIAASNICLPCHSGRANGAVVSNLNTSGQPTTVDFSNLMPTDSHDFPDAAIMYRALGYTYAGRNYDNPTSYKHDQIGSSAVPNTGTSGPCKGCHMYRSDQVANHLFSNVTKNGDSITNISSEVCYNCHAGSSTQIADMAETERLACNDALSALGDVLTTAGFSSSSTNWLSQGYQPDTDTMGNHTGKNNLGAYFNYASLGNAPGAFVHNSKYVKKLIYDSIDWLDDNMLNYSVGTTLSTSCTVTTPPSWCTNAQTYLLPNGVRSGAPSERPY